jgi:hypothetical protein
MKDTIERINGYCTEVNQAQWEELVRVADEVGCNFIDNDDCRYLLDKYGKIKAGLNTNDSALVGYTQPTMSKMIPFPDFIAKLRGVEEWKPKAGEMVEVSNNGEKWYVLEYITNRNDAHVCWSNSGLPHTSYYRYIRPLTPTITRAEAEAKLKTLGVNVKITD